MERYTKEQRVIIVKTPYKYGESYGETVRKMSSHAMAIRIGHRGEKWKTEELQEASLHPESRNNTLKYRCMRTDGGIRA
jgi:hypothetical protein